MITRIEPDWFLDFDNDPRLIVYVDQLSPLEQFRYVKREAQGGRFWFASLPTGEVRYFWDDDRDHQGYGGRIFGLTTEEDMHVELHGPWSSNPSAILQAGFPPCMETLTRIDGDDLSGYAATWLVDALLPRIRHDVAIDWVPVGTRPLPHLSGEQDAMVRAGIDDQRDPELSLPRIRPARWSFGEFYYRRRIARSIKYEKRLLRLSLDILRKLPQDLVREFAEMELIREQTTEKQERWIAYTRHLSEYIASSSWG